MKTATLAHNVVPLHGQVGQVEGDSCQPQHQPQDAQTHTQPGTPAGLSCPRMSSWYFSLPQELYTEHFLCLAGDKSLL